MEVWILIGILVACLIVGAWYAVQDYAIPSPPPESVNPRDWVKVSEPRVIRLSDPAKKGINWPRAS